MLRTRKGLTHIDILKNSRLNWGRREVGERLASTSVQSDVLNGRSITWYRPRGGDALRLGR